MDLCTASSTNDYPLVEKNMIRITLRSSYIPVPSFVIIPIICRILEAKV
jgi:hypothetical protein